MTTEYIAFGLGIVTGLVIAWILYVVWVERTFGGGNPKGGK